MILAFLLLVCSLAAADRPAHADALDDVVAAESLLANNGMSAAIARFDEVLDRDGLDAGLRGRALRGKLLGQIARNDIDALGTAVDAVVADPGYGGNHLLLITLSGLLSVEGAPDGWPEQMARLEAVAADHPALAANAAFLTAMTRDLAGEWDRMPECLDRAGILDDLMAAGPFDNAGSSGIRRRFPPEDPIDVEDEYAGRLGKPVRWARAHSDPYGLFNPDYFLDDEPNAVLYLLTHVRSQSAGPALLHLSGNGSFRAWVNGELVIDEPRYRTGTYALYAPAVQLDEGWNQILVKVGAELEPLFARLRLTDPEGRPLGLESSAAPPPGFGGFAVEAAAEPAPPRFGPDDWHLRTTEWPLGDGFVDRVIVLRDLLSRQFLDESKPLLDELLEEYPTSCLVAELESGWNDRMGIPADVARAEVIVDAAPECFAARLGRVNRLQEEGLDDEATAALEQFREDFPDDPAAQALSGYVRMLRGEPASGMAAIEAAFRDHPSNLQVQQLYLSALRNRNREQEVRAVLEECHAARPDLPDVSRQLAAVAWRAQDVDAALEWLDRALDANAPPVQTLSERATVLESVGRTGEALASLQEGLTWSPLNVGLRQQIANLELELDRTDEAIDQLEYALALDPTNGNVRELLRQLRGQPPLRDLLEPIALDDLRDADLSWADPSASAVYLLDDVMLTIFASGAHEYRRHYAIAIRDQGGIGTYRNFDEVTGRDFGGELEIARILKPDGREIQAEVGRGELSFPDLQIGDVIEIRTVSTGGPVPGLPGEFWGDNAFQYESPCLVSRYALLAPPAMEFDWRMHSGEAEHRSRDLGEWKLHEWVVEKIPSVFVETSTPSALDFTTWVDVTSVRDWSVIVDWYLSESEGRLDPTAGIERFAADVAAQADSDSARIHLVTDWVQDNIEYEGGQFVDSPTVPRAPDDVLVSRYGDCKDQSGLIIATLRALGIESHYALVNSREVGATDYLPSTRFSHAIVHARTASGREYWIDPTNDQLGFPNVPRILEGMTALLIDEGRDSPFVTIPLDPPDLDGTESRVRVRLVDGDTFALTGTCSYLGEDAADFRSVARLVPEYLESGMEQVLGESFPGAVVDSVNFDPGRGRQDPFVCSYGAEAPVAAAEAGDLRIVPVPWLMWEMPRDLVGTRSRIAPIELGSWRGQNSEEVILELPEGTSVMSLGDPVVLETDFGRFEASRTLDPEGRLHCRKALRIDVFRIEPERYDEFREFVLAAVKAEDEQLVLKGLD